MRKSFSALGILSPLETHEVEFWPYRAVEIEQKRLRGRLSRGALILQGGADPERDAFSGSAPGAGVERHIRQRAVTELEDHDGWRAEFGSPRARRPTASAPSPT